MTVAHMARFSFSLLKSWFSNLSSFALTAHLVFHFLLHAKVVAQMNPLL